ncbi:Proteasome assembly chaperone 2 [Mortierella polycephala]|uniref:Proteasome assembly chaperone 2 n=1 Tax=Mortierella polycephala TaxID=41804 RepID=A0A9P6QD01_9FUNG|nr:Proteasome assembly chaperone 2 [Mortierella polycephala]
MNTFVASPHFDTQRLKGSTLILPSVSIGNVPQLATDLLLSTLQLDRVGAIEDENVIPVLGPADCPHDATVPVATAAAPGGLSLAVEVFQSKDGKWTLIQQRSPTVRHRSHHYADNLIKFIQDAEFQQVVLLASADGARRIDVQLRSGTPVRYIPSPAVPKELTDNIKRLGLEILENVPTTEDERREAIRRRNEEHALAGTQQHQDAASTSSLAERVQDIQLEGQQSEQQLLLEKVPRIPNGGIARRLHSICQEKGIAILTVVLFAMEGDNAPDAILLANVLNAIFKIHVPTQEQIMDGSGDWKFPKSWDSLYGNTFHQDMYQ